MMASKLRRVEFKRGRKRRWRARKRHPFFRLLRKTYGAVGAAIRSAAAELRRFNESTDMRDHGPATTLATSQEVASVNYGGTESRIPLIWGKS